MDELIYYTGAVIILASSVFILYLTFDLFVTMKREERRERRRSEAFERDLLRRLDERDGTASESVAPLMD